MVRVILADDHRIVREGIALMLADLEDIQIVGEAEDGPGLLALLDTTPADIILLDIRLPGMSGIQVLKHLKQTASQVRVVVLSMHDEPAYVTKAIELGADAYLLKSASRDELLRAIRLVVDGGTYIQGELTGALIDRVVGRSDGTAQLGPRALEVLKLLSHGYENRQISIELQIAEATVKAHLRTIYSTLAVRGRAEAVAVALRMGLID